MGEYIEREALLEKMKNWHEKVSLIACVTSMPAADVAPVRHGRWECNKPCPVCGGDRFEGLDADIWADWEPPYCPNCGSKMDGHSGQR